MKRISNPIRRRTAEDRFALLHQFIDKGIAQGSIKKWGEHSAQTGQEKIVFEVGVQMRGDSVHTVQLSGMEVDVLTMGLYAGRQSAPLDLSRPQIQALARLIQLNVGRVTDEWKSFGDREQQLLLDTLQALATAQTKPGLEN